MENNKMKREFESLLVTKKQLEQKKLNLQKQLLSVKKKVHELVEVEHENNEEENEIVSVEEAALLSQSEELNECLSIYRLFGVSVIDADEGTMHLRFDTSFKDHYFESYQIKLEQGNDGPIVSQHTLPCFVPLQFLCNHQLKTSLCNFALGIQTYLLSYVRRREQVAEVKEKYNKILCGNIDYSMAYDYICCHFKVNSGSLLFIINITLIYCLKSYFPSEVRIEIPAANNNLRSLKENYEAAMNDKAHIFKENILFEAMEKFLQSVGQDD